MTKRELNQAIKSLGTVRKLYLQWQGYGGETSNDIYISEGDYAAILADINDKLRPANEQP